MSQDEKNTAPEPIRHSTAREYFVTTVVCTIFALFVTTYVVHPMTVPTPSMHPTIMVGDRLLIDKFTIRNGFVDSIPLTPAHEIKRGDVLVFKYPEQPETLYVKRLIGLPGEVVEVRNSTVFINSEPIDEPYKFLKSRQEPATRNPHAFLSYPLRENFGPVRVPEGMLFMMGDNRENSQDSRVFGFLPEKNVVGRPLFVFWSYEDADGAHERSDLLKLYVERILGFFPKTRWTRTGHIIR